MENNKSYYLLDYFIHYPLIHKEILTNFKLHYKNNILYGYKKSDIIYYHKNQLVLDKNYIDQFYTLNCKDFPLIEIPESTKICYDNKISNIEMRGEFDINKILYRAKDISTHFNILKLNVKMIDDQYSYKINIDYKYINNNNQLLLYLTHLGLLRVISIYNSNALNIIHNWTHSNLVLTITPKNNNHKECSYQNYFDILYQIFNKIDFPCIYFLNIKKYKEYKNIYKFGRTDNFARRFKEHIKKYGDIEVSMLQYIDKQYLSKAEIDVNHYFKKENSFIDDKDSKELVIIDDKNFKNIKNLYKKIGEKYSVNIIKLQNEIDLLLVKINDITIEKESKILYYENLLTLNSEIFKNKLLEKEKEILEIKLNNYNI